MLSSLIVRESVFEPMYSAGSEGCESNLTPALAVHHNMCPQNKSRYIKFHENVFLTLLIR